MQSSTRSPPDVDVLIPVRNGARFLSACLDSVFAQSSPARAVIVVDDGSTDETPRVLAEYAACRPNLQVIRSEARGVSHARNLALRASEAPFVAFLDSDDVWHPDKLARQMPLFAPDRPEIGFVHCSFFYIDETGSRIHDDKVIPPRKRGEIFADLLAGYVLSGSASAVVARRDLMIEASGFDETLFHGEDWDAWLKLARSSHVDFVPEALTGIRVHPTSSQRQDSRRRAETFLFQRLQIVDKWIAQLPVGADIIDQCRIEAIRVAIKSAMQLPPRWGLYGRLAASDVPLARKLFPDRRTYFRFLGKAAASAAERRTRKLRGRTHAGGVT